MTADRRSDGQLLAATSVDPDAFAVFYRRHAEGVLGFVTGRARPVDVGDVVSEVFATALVHRRRYDPGRGTARAWLIGIAQHKIADAARRGSVDTKLYRRIGASRVELEITEIGPESLADDLLQELPEAQRRAVTARVFSDKPYAQIAREEAVSEQVARKRVSRALHTLRSRFVEGER